MHMKYLRTYSSLILGMCLLTLGGCGASIDPKVAAELRGKYLLQEEPADPQGLLDLSELMKGQEEKPLVVIGMIGGVADPWTKNKTSFIITDPAAVEADESADAKADSKAHAHKGHDHKDHDPATCPFCSKKIKEPEALALIEFRNSEGKVLPYDAQQLFGVQKQQLVVVKGKVRQDASGYWLVAADGIYVRR